MNYLSVDIDLCRINRHRFKVVASDKTPMRRSLACITCSDATGKSAYAAYPDVHSIGDPAKCFGQWRTAKRQEEDAGSVDH